MQASVVRPHSLNVSSETTGPIKVKFHIELLWDGGIKVWSHDQDGCHAHVEKKTQKNLLRNQKADDLETWYAALAARVLPSLFK